MELVRFVVVGAGSIGREFALKHITRDVGAKVVAIVDSNVDLAGALATDVRYAVAGGVVGGTKYGETVDKSDVTMGMLEAVQEVGVFARMEDCLQSMNPTNIDAVYIGTPPSTHKEVTLCALAARKHVLLEKPIAISDEDTDEIVAAAEAAYNSSITTERVITNVNIGMRYNAAVHELRSRILNRTIGDLQSMTLKLQFVQWYDDH
jgi:predicted dehydrogenase